MLNGFLNFIFLSPFRVFEKFLQRYLRISKITSAVAANLSIFHWEGVHPSRGGGGTGGLRKGQIPEPLDLWTEAQIALKPTLSRCQKSMIPISYPTSLWCLLRYRLLLIKVVDHPEKVTEKKSCNLTI
jgi:hypothetical protein